MKQLLFVVITFPVLCQLRELSIDDNYIFPFLDTTRELLMTQCNATNEPDLLKDIQTIAYDSMVCITQKTSDNLTLEENLEYSEKCTQNLRTKYKLCVTEPQQYFPDIIYDVELNLLRFAYEFTNIDTYAADIAKCNKLIEKSAKKERAKCLRTLEKPLEILDSKELFCEPLVTAYDCLANLITQTCEENDNIVRYGDTISNYFTKTCGEAE